MSRSLADTQYEFSAALRNPERPVPVGVVGDVKRFAVYRNNITVSLIEALRTRFPVTRQLVGEGFFRAMARAYVLQHKPRSPLLMEYGGDFSDFIAAFEPAAEVPYLSDVARLEAAWSEAYHAADATPLSVDAVTQLRSMSLANTGLELHPSVRLICSLHPIASLWAAHQTEGEVTAPKVWEPEDVMIVRPHTQVCLFRLRPGGHALISALVEIASLERAAARALVETEAFDFGGNVLDLFHAGAVVQYVTVPSGGSS